MKLLKAIKETLKDSRRLLKDRLAAPYIKDRREQISREMRHISPTVAQEYTLLKSERKKAKSFKTIREIDEKLFRLEIIRALQATSVVGFRNPEGFYKAYIRMIERKRVLQKNPNLDEEYLNRRKTVETIIGSPYELENFESALRIIRIALNKVALKGTRKNEVQNKK